MIYGSLIFTGKDVDLQTVEKIIEVDTTSTEIFSSDILLEGPSKFDLYEGAIRYSISMIGTSWVNIVDLQETLLKHKADVEIVLAVTDGATYVDVITTNGDTDIEVFENENPEYMVRICETYGFGIEVSGVVSEVYEEDEEDELDQEEDDMSDEWVD